MQVVKRIPLVIVKAQGTRVWDNDGKMYLDFMSGWSCLNIGHSNPAVSEAIREQATLVTQTTNLFYTLPQLKLAQLLVDNSALDRVFFCNSGAEANEGACKLARKWGKTQLNGAYEIITATNSFHGRTMAMIAATGQPKYQEAWKPLMPGFVNVPYNDLDAITQATTDKTCAVLLEPVQGEGGVNVPDENYLYEVQEWCRSTGVLFMLDEVQTGIGRLGTLFGYQRFEFVEPDVMTLGKALGGGVPLGAFACKEQYSVLEPGDHGTTFGGNALTTAAGGAMLEYMLEKDVPAQALKLSELLFARLNDICAKLPIAQSARGMGLLVALQLTDDVSYDVATRCIAEGLIVNAVQPSALRFLPPLTTTAEELNEGLDILERVLANTLGG